MKGIHVMLKTHSIYKKYTRLISDKMISNSKVHNEVWYHVVNEYIIVLFVCLFASRTQPYTFLLSEM